MIFKEFTVTVKGNESTINEPIYLYKYDQNVELRFNVGSAKYKYTKSDNDNIVIQSNASYCQVRFINTVTEAKYTFDICPTVDGQAVLLIKGELIDEEAELGIYDFQIRLLDESRNSIASLPPVKGAIHIEEPLFESINTATADSAVADISMLSLDGDTIDTYNPDGTYNQTNWANGDIISSAKLNKLEKVAKDNVDKLKAIGTGGTVASNVEPTDGDTAKLFLTGAALPTSKTNVNLEYEYVSKTKQVKGYAKVKCQGNSSMSYAKKNFTIQFYKDAEFVTKQKFNFKGWGEQSKFCTKANWVDSTHTRNISGARIARDMVESRPNSEFKTHLQTAPRNGLVDGFPIRMYFNGEFYGIYTMNIPKDAWTFNMDKDNPNHMVLCAERNTDGNASLINSCQFRQLWTNADGQDWSVEVGTLTDAMRASFNRCIGFVMNATDEDFHSKISEYFDLYSLIDYYCFTYLCCHLDGLAKNMLMVTYDGVHWGASLYDMDSIFGVSWDGSRFVATDYKCPEQYQEQFSKLWVRMEKCFAQEIHDRYVELRKGALSLGNIVRHVENIYDAISDRDFKDEAEKWTNIPNKTANTMTRFRNYMRDRAVYVDAQMEDLLADHSVTALALDKKTATLNITTGNDATSKNYLEGISSQVATNGNIEFSPIALTRGVYEFKNINDGAFTWLEYTLNGERVIGINSTDSITLYITEASVSVIFNAYPDNNAKNTADKLGLYKVKDLTVSNSISLTKTGDGYFTGNGITPVVSTNDEYCIMDIDSTKTYTIFCDKTGTVCIPTIPKKVEGVGFHSIIIKNTPKLYLSITKAAGIENVKLIEVELTDVKDKITTIYGSTTLKATLTPNNADIKDVTWATDNANVTLVPSGLSCKVTAASVGQSVVTCTSADTTNGTIKDTCTVTVQEGNAGIDTERTVTCNKIGYGFNENTGAIEKGSTPNYAVCEEYIPVKKGTKYRMTTDCTGAPWIAVVAYNSDYSFNSFPVNVQGTSSEFTAPSEYIRVGSSTKDTTTPAIVTITCLEEKPRYTELECITSSGTQYINTEFIPTANTKVVMDVNWKFTKQYNYLFGADNMMRLQGFSEQGIIVGGQLGYALSGHIISNLYGIRHIISLDNKNPYKCTVDAQVYPLEHQTTMNSTNKNLLLLCGYNVNNLEARCCGTASVYACKVYENDTLVRDFIPVLDSSNVACLYDKVNNKFYYNSGTGEFTYEGTSGGNTSPDTSNKIFNIDSTCLNTTNNTLTDSVSGLAATLTGTPTISNNQLAFDDTSSFDFDITSLNLASKDITLRVKFAPTSLTTSFANVITFGDGSWNKSWTTYISDAKLLMQSTWTNIENVLVGSNSGQPDLNRLTSTPTINTEYELVLSYRASDKTIRYYIDGVLVQDGNNVVEIPEISKLCNTEGNSKFAGTYSVIDMYDQFCETYEDFTNLANK